MKLTNDQKKELADLVEAMSKQWDMLSKQIYYTKRINETSQLVDMYREIGNARSECNNYLAISNELLVYLDQFAVSK